MEAAIEAPSIRVSGSLISVIRTVTIGLVDAVDWALRARSTQMGVDGVNGRRPFCVVSLLGAIIS